MEWRHFSRCDGADSDVFFDVTRVDEAKAFCEECPVRAYCEWEATHTQSEGVWGGMTRKQRIAKNGHEPIRVTWGWI